MANRASEWDITSDNNTDIFPENQAPSTVNDGGRDVQAGIRFLHENIEFRDFGDTPTRTANTIFTVPGDQTAVYHAGRRMEFTDSSTLRGTIVSSVFTSLTTVTVTLDSGNLSASLTVVKVGYAVDQVSIGPNAISTDTFTASLLSNLSFTASVGSNNLTIALKDLNGNDATASTPVRINFRNSTLTTGDYATRSVTAALTAILDAGGTLGFTSSETGFIYIYAIDNAGTVEIALSRKALFDEAITHDTTTLSSGSDDDSTLFSEVGRTGVAVRLIGRITIQTDATAGNWTNAPTVLSVWNPAMKKTGDVVQCKSSISDTFQTTAVTIPNDDTIPQNTEGAEFTPGNVSITARDAVNTFKITCFANISSSTISQIVIGLFKDSETDALEVGTEHSSATDRMEHIQIIRFQTAGSTSAITYRLRFGGSSASTRINGVGATRRFGGALRSGIIVEEISA